MLAPRASLTYSPVSVFRKLSLGTTVKCLYNLLRHCLVQLRQDSQGLNRSRQANMARNGNVARQANILAGFAATNNTNVVILSFTSALEQLVMNPEKSELEQAWEELCFWRHFATIWEADKTKSVEPRVLEALKNAENRYLNATPQNASGAAV
jgi:hypothetical protein